MSVKYHTTTHGTTKVYHIEGKLIDNLKSVEMMQTMNADIILGTTNIVFDLSSLEYINSSGLNVFLTILRNVKDKGGSICMCNANDKIIELLLITKLNKVFKNYHSLEKALEAV